MCSRSENGGRKSVPGWMRIFQFHKNDFFSNLTDTAPGNPALMFSPEPGRKTTRTRNDQCQYLTAFRVNIHVNDTAKGCTGTYVNNLFLTKFT